VRDEGLCRVGWSSKSAKLALGTDKEGFGFGGTGKKSFSANFHDYGESYGLNDVIGCLIDRNQGFVSFSKNGFLSCLYFIYFILFYLCSHLNPWNLN